MSPGYSSLGFPPGIVVGGAIHAADAVALQAQTDTTTAYDTLAGEACNTTYGVPTDLGGQTLVPGVYCFASSAGLRAHSRSMRAATQCGFHFKVGSTLITASDASVVLINGATAVQRLLAGRQLCDPWHGDHFIGTILALASITLDTNATLPVGRWRRTVRSRSIPIPSPSPHALSPINSPPVLGESLARPPSLPAALNARRLP